MLRSVDLHEVEETWQTIIRDQPHLTFGDLKEGDKFIGFPLPGDNSGHGGFLNGTYLFKKVQPSSTKGQCPHNAVNVNRNVPSHMPDSMPVIKIL